MAELIVSACRECGGEATFDASGLAGAFRVQAQRWASMMLCEPCAEREAEAEEAERQAELDRKVRELWARRIKQSGVPRVDAGFRWPDNAAGRAAREWADRRSLTLVLTGPVGTGKTTLAAAAFRERAKPVLAASGGLLSKPTAWRSATAYMAALGSGFGSKLKDEAAELAQGGWMLGLDDLDKTRPTPYAAEAMFGLIDGAVASRSPLVVTMNSGLADLAEKFGGEGAIGDAIASRLAQGTVVRLDGADRRLERRAA